MQYTCKQNRTKNSVCMCWPYSWVWAYTHEHTHIHCESITSPCVELGWAV